MSKKVEVRECNKGDWWVDQVDDCYGCQSICRVIGNVTKAIAKSYVRHMNKVMYQLDKEVGEQIPIYYYADCHDSHDIGDMYGGISILMHS